MQIDPSTYTTEPAGDAYQDWLSATELDGMKGDISDLLVKNVEVRALYTQLVSTSHKDSSCLIPKRIFLISICLKLVDLVELRNQWF